MPCPNKLCNNKNIPEEYFFTFLNEEQYLKYQNFKSQNQISKDPNKIFCPICNSYAEINENKNIINTNNSNYKKTKLKCKNGHEFCSCGRPNHEGNCYKDENEFISYLKEQKIKKCPKCGFLIKKDHGCNHMTCGNPNCKYEFCWICLGKYTNNHFLTGGCFQNKEWKICEFKIVRIIYKFFFFILLCLLFCLLTLPFIFVTMNDKIFYRKKIKINIFIIIFVLFPYFVSFEILYFCLIFLILLLSVFYPPFFYDYPRNIETLMDGF